MISLGTDCFQTNGTRASEVNPTCLAHKGPDMGYTVLEYGTTERRPGGPPVLREVGYSILSFTYDGEENKDDHLALAKTQTSTNYHGAELSCFFFDNIKDARQKLTLLQTVALFRKLRRLKLKLTTVDINLAVGLEERL